MWSLQCLQKRVFSAAWLILQTLSAESMVMKCSTLSSISGADTSDES